MKIIQICVALDAEGNESLYGLDDRGNTYIHVTAYEAKRYVKSLTDRDGKGYLCDHLPKLDPPLNLAGDYKYVHDVAQVWNYTNGWTGGWKLVTVADAPLAHPTYHPEDPEH